MKQKKDKRTLILGVISAIIIISIDLSLLLLKAAKTPGGNSANTISQIIIVIIIALFITGLIQLIKKKDKPTGLESSIPSHLTAIGMLGTFAGIFIGLYNFNVNDIAGSVPLLLEGMKVAFSTSIAGLVSSIGLKLTHSIVIRITQEDPLISLGTGSDSLSLIINMTDSSFQDIIKRFEELRSHSSKLSKQYIEERQELEKLKKERELEKEDSKKHAEQMKRYKMEWEKNQEDFRNDVLKEKRKNNDTNSAL